MADTHTFPLVLTHPKVKGETTVNSERSLAVMQRRGWRPKTASSRKKSTKKSAGTSKSTGASGGPSKSDDAT